MLPLWFVWSVPVFCALTVVAGLSACAVRLVRQTAKGRLRPSEAVGLAALALTRVAVLAAGAVVADVLLRRTFPWVLPAGGTTSGQVTLWGVQIAISALFVCIWEASAAPALRRMVLPDRSV